MADDKPGGAAERRDGARAQARRMLDLARELLDAAEAIIDEPPPHPQPTKGGKA
jgi:hypothetical protein